MVQLEIDSPTRLVVLYGYKRDSAAHRHLIVYVQFDESYESNRFFCLNTHLLVCAVSVVKCVLFIVNALR